MMWKTLKRWVKSRREGGIILNNDAIKLALR